MQEQSGEGGVFMRSRALSALVRAHQRLVADRERQRAGLAAPDPTLERELDAVAERITRLLARPAAHDD